MNGGELFLSREAQQIPGGVLTVIKVLPTENTGVGACVAAYRESQSDGTLDGNEELVSAGCLEVALGQK